MPRVHLAADLGPPIQAANLACVCVLCEARQLRPERTDPVFICVVNRLRDGEQLKQLIEALPEQAIGVDFHPNGLILQGHSPQEAIVDLGPCVVHVHACDAVRNLSGGQGAEVELGRGMAEFPSLLGQLEEFGYRDWVTIERHDSVDPIAEVGNAIAYLRELTH